MYFFSHAKKPVFEHVYLRCTYVKYYFIFYLVKKQNAGKTTLVFSIFDWKLVFIFFSLDFDCAITSFANEMKVSRFFTTVPLFFLLCAQLLSFLVQTALNWIRYFFYLIQNLYYQTNYIHLCKMYV